MDVEPIGIATLVVALLCWANGPAFSIYALLTATLLGSSAAIILTFLNQANVQPAHLLLGFISADLVRRRTLMPSLSTHPAGFWLMITVGYGVLASLILPRLFAGTTDVFVLRSSDIGLSGQISKVPLGPVTANITQSIYFVGDLVGFLIFASFVRNPRGLTIVAKAVVFCACVNILFAALDLATYWTGTAHLLSFMRNASYRMLDDIQIEGLKRIVGSFSEASSFAYATAALYAFVSTLWIEGVMVGICGIAAALSLVLIAFATSSTGYMVLAVLLPLQYLAVLVKVLQGRASARLIILLVVLPLVAGLAVCIVLLDPTAQATISRLADTLLFNKLATSSGIERNSWNAQAMIVFADTYGLGAGIGSVRASSFAVAVLANIGISGALAYFTFLACVLMPSAPIGSHQPRAIQTAAKVSCFTQLIASMAGASSIDLGLMFFAIAAVASTPIIRVSPACYERDGSRDGRIPA
jgi:hypothetical protein